MLSCCGADRSTNQNNRNGHMTHQEKDIICRGSGDEDLLTLSPIYCDVIARVRIHYISFRHSLSLSSLNLLSLQYLLCLSQVLQYT